MIHTGEITACHAMLSPLSALAESAGGASTLGGEDSSEVELLAACCWHWTSSSNGRTACGLRGRVLPLALASTPLLQLSVGFSVSYRACVPEG